MKYQDVYKNGVNMGYHVTSVRDYVDNNNGRLNSEIHMQTPYFNKDKEPITGYAVVPITHERGDVLRDANTVEFWTKGHNMDTIKKKIGNNLKKLRTKKGLKQSELAELVGVEDKTISRIEVGGNYPSMDLLVRLAEALNCELVDFVNFSDKIIDSINELSKDDLKVLEKFVFLLKDKI